MLPPIAPPSHNFVPLHNDAAHRHLTLLGCLPCQRQCLLHVIAVVHVVLQKNTTPPGRNPPKLGWQIDVFSYASSRWG